MEYGESEQVLSALYRLANDDPASALSCLQELDRVFGEDIYYRAFQPGLVINIGMSLGDLALVKVGTDSLLRVLETDDPRISEWRKALLYNLGNGLSELLAKSTGGNTTPTTRCCNSSNVPIVKPS
jgi:hypothetical protein